MTDCARSWPISVTRLSVSALVSIYHSRKLPTLSYRIAVAELLTGVVVDDISLVILAGVVGFAHTH